MKTPIRKTLMFRDSPRHIGDCAPMPPRRRTTDADGKPQPYDPTTLGNTNPTKTTAGGVQVVLNVPTGDASEGDSDLEARVSALEAAVAILANGDVPDDDEGRNADNPGPDYNGGRAATGDQARRRAPVPPPSHWQGQRAKTNDAIKKINAANAARTAVRKRWGM